MFSTSINPQLLRYTSSSRIVTRSSTKAARLGTSDSPLLDLPDELLIGDGEGGGVVHSLLTSDVRARIISAARLREVCSSLRDRLSSIVGAPAIERARLPYWQPHLTWKAILSGPLSSIVQPHKLNESPFGFRRGWAAAAQLPLSRVSWFTFSGVAGFAFVGICTADATCGWGFNCATANFWQWSKDADGTIGYCKPAKVPEAFRQVRAAGGRQSMATGHGTKVMSTMGFSHPERMVHFEYRPSDGELGISFVLGSNPRVNNFETILEGFPANEPVRPFVLIDGNNMAVRLRPSPGGRSLGNFVQDDDDEPLCVD